MAYHHYHGLDTHIVRIFNTYGPRMRLDDGRVVPNFICQALANQPITIHGEGTQTRSFCYIDDLIEGLCRLLMSDIHLPVNLGNPNEITMLELGESINQITGSTAGLLRHSAERVPTDPERRQPDITRAKELLQWEPKVPLEVGLRRTIEDFRKRLSS
jgi:dTDP-glucose 4,6-dehydratase